MNFLIEWKDTGYQEIMTFGILKKGENALNKPNDDRIFYWLNEEEARDIGADYDGGDWFVVCCACDECESQRYAESFVEIGGE
jgi:hypothetical protein